MRVCAIDVPLPADAPETVPVVLTVQLNVAPEGDEVKAIAVVAPPQIVTGLGLAVATGKGLTVTGTLTAVPGQPDNVGVTVYVATPLPVNVCAIDVPLPAVAPETVPVVLTVHAKVEPVGTELKAIEVVAPLQIETGFGVAVATGKGLTVTGTVIAEPGQEPKVGVTV